MASFAWLDKYVREQERALSLVLRAQEQGINRLTAQYQDQLQRLNDVIGTNLSRALAGIADSDRWQANQKRYVAVMLALGWPPIMDLYVPQTNEIIARFDPADPGELADEVSAFLVKFFDEKALALKLAEWRELKWVDRRLPILEKVVEAHVRGDYELSVPSMLPQIEGIVASGFGYAGRLTGRDLDRLYDLLLSQGGDITDAAYRDFIGTVLLVSFQHGEPIGSNFSRHAILHGADTDYATGANSLRAILLFDYLVSAFRLVALGSSRVFHMPGCSHVVRSSRNRAVLSSRAEAVAGGLIPCQRCRPDQQSLL